MPLIGQMKSFCLSKEKRVCHARAKGPILAATAIILAITVSLLFNRARNEATD